MRSLSIHGRSSAEALACALLIAACGGDATEPAVSTTGAIRVTLSMTGLDRPTGYSIIVGGRQVAANQDGVATISGLLPGAHIVRLLLAPNCQVEGDNPRTTTVVAGETAPLAFSATCAATTGSVRVTTTTTGVDPDPNGYTVRIEGFNMVGVRFQHGASIATNETAIHAAIPAGHQTVTIAGLSVNCDPVGANPRPVSVVAAETVAVAFDIGCVRASSQLAHVIQSGDGRTHIHLSNADGTGGRRLIDHPSSDEDPAWSPDGSKIAFTTDRDGNREIYVADADGSNVVRLTSDPAADYEPAWSPDGGRIAFVSERDNQAEIFVMNADGTNAVRLTSDPARDGDPAWSPDGRSIAFTSDRDGKADIYVMNADGSGVTRLTTDGGRTPAWSPDGTGLAYTATYCPGYPYACWESIFIKVGNNSLRPVSFGPGEAPAWSPDGRKIAFSSITCDFYFIRCENVGVRIGRVDDTDVIDVAGGFGPAWRP